MDIHDFEAHIDNTLARNMSIKLNSMSPLQEPMEETSVAPTNAEKSSLISHQQSSRPSRFQSLLETSFKLKFRKTNWRNWLLELIACVSATLGFAGLIAVLASYSGKEVTSSSMILTPNAAVAALSTLIRASMLLQITSILSQEKWKYLGNGRSGRPITALTDFDDASRGAWGCVKFLCRQSTGALRSRMGAVCAILTILALAFDTFPQLVFTTTGSTHNITIPGLLRSEFYDNTEVGVLEVNRNFDLRFRAALYNSFVTGLANDVEPTCPTGNCTWPLTPTLGVCGNCTDVTDRITVSNCTTSPFNSGYISGTKLCNYTLPSGHVLPESLANSIANLNGTRSNEHLEYAQSFDVAYLGQKPIYGSYNGTYPFMGFSAAGFSNHALNSTVGTEYQVFATECQLSFCVKALNTTTSFGEVRSSVVETWNHTVGNEVASFTDVPPQYTPRGEENVNAFTLGAGFLVALSQTGGPPVFGNCSFSEAGDSTCESDYVHGIMNVLDYDSYILNVSTALTAVMRQTATAPSNDTRYYGSATQQLVVWHVRWLWIIYPSVLLLVSTAICMIAVFEKDIPTPVPWKGDPLALLFCNVDEGLREAFVSSGGDIDEIRNRLKHTRGLLYLGENGWTVLPVVTE